METVVTIIDEHIGPPPLPNFPPPRYPPPSFQVPKLSLSLQSSDDGNTIRRSSLGNIINSLIVSNTITFTVLLHLILDEIVRFTSGGASIYSINQYILDAQVVKTPRRSDLSVTCLQSKNITLAEDDAIKRNINKCQFATKPFSSTENLHTSSITFRYIPIHDPLKDNIIGILVLSVKHQKYIDAFHEKLWNEKDMDCIKDIIIEVLRHSHTQSPSSDQQPTPPIISNAISSPASSKIEMALAALEEIVSDGKAEYHIHHLRHLIYDRDRPSQQTLSDFTLEDIIRSFSRYIPIHTTANIHQTYVGDFGNMMCMMRHILYEIGIDNISGCIEVHFNAHQKDEVGDNIPGDIVFGKSTLPKIAASINETHIREKMRNILSLPKKVTLAVTMRSPDRLITPNERLCELVTYTKKARIKMHAHHVVITIPVYENEACSSFLQPSVLGGEKQQYQIAKILQRKLLGEYNKKYSGKRLMVVCRSGRLSLFLAEIYGIWGIQTQIAKSLGEAIRIIKYTKKKRTSMPFISIMRVLDSNKPIKKQKKMYKSIPIHYITAKYTYLDTKKLFLKTFS